MALMRVEIQRTAVPSIAGGANVNFLHGLKTTPDAVLIQFVDSALVTTGWHGICAAIDVNRVTLSNDGNRASGDMVICAMTFHSIIQ